MYLAAAAAIAAAILLFTSTVGFWIACVLGLLVVAYTYFFVLKRLPSLTFEGLSLEADALLSEYNHAWAAPGLTRITSFEIAVWQILCIASGLYFVFNHAWWSLVAIFGVYNAFSYMAGAINPQMHIAKKGLGDANDEIVAAYLARNDRRHPELISLIDEAISKTGSPPPPGKPKS